MARVNTAIDLTSTKLSSEEVAPAQTSSDHGTENEQSASYLSDEDRRAWQRFMLEDPAHITLQVAGRDAFERVPLVDVSLGGFRLHLTEELPHDSEVAVCHPTAGTMRGRLAWQTDSDIGIRMLDDENRRTYLLRLISMILHSEIQVEAV
ncbi:PilZ domain-containing protein [Pelagibius sp. Alg239-R121]|uniref:PilZ domain-containing protein n=1 Tax=Pelagibius sp. Alg239-R121 TaxID=2993448 RepID=UPI0024A738F5|nr:PilZ domain-containing protein [Pelagibius sp. Alg239-R121]